MNLSSRVANWSLRKKLISVIMLSSMVCLLVTLGVLLSSSIYSRYQAGLQGLTATADVLAESGQAALMFSDRAEATRLLDSLTDHDIISAAWLVAADGTVLASWVRRGSNPAAEAMPANYRVQSLHVVSDLVSRRAELYRPVTRSGEQVGHVLLRADFTNEWLRALGDFGQALGAGAVALVVVLLLAIRLQAFITRPFSELADAARLIARNKTYGLRVHQRTQDEIGELVREFNNMLSEIQKRDLDLTRHRDRLEAEVAARTAELVQSRDQAEAASRFKSMFLANMSHEIRTPLNAIIGLSELAAGPETSPRSREYLGKIHSSSEALLRIINDILDFSKVEAGRMEIESEEFQVEALLDSVANLFIVQAEEKGLELVFEICPGVPGRLRGDALRLGQVINNLVGNAVKFTERGEVHVKVSQVAEAAGFSTVCFSVYDTGIGMGPEQLTQLFQPFTQGDGSITRRFGGSGLGLAISKRLVDMMGGEFTVASDKGVGSTFSFTIRLPVAAGGAVIQLPPALSSARVLIVDDLDMSRQILRKILAVWDFYVAEAASGDEALAHLEKASATGQPFDLVVLDWKMPGMDGVQLARAIRAQAREGRIQDMPVVIMVTAFAREQLLAEAHDVALDAILVKPVLPSALLDTIIRLQNGNGHQAPEIPVPFPARAARAQLLGAHILLVEDHEINQMVARAFLENAGMKVTIANNGQEGVAAVRTGQFDAVLMDLHMPVMDGLEAARQIRSDIRLRRLPVIAMTAAVMEEDRAACEAAGVDDHVAKPIRPQELLDVLGRWIRPDSDAAAPCDTGSASARARRLPREPAGFDFGDVLMVLNGDEGKLRELLLRFGDEFADVAERLRELVEARKMAEAVALAHKTKGAAANLGAVRLCAAAARLEQELAGSGAHATLPEFDEALQAAITFIAGIVREENAPSPAEKAGCGDCNVNHAAELFRQLAALLEGDDFVPHELMGKLKDALPCQSMQERLSQVEKHVAKFDYGRARAALAGLGCTRGHDFRESIA